MYKRLDWQKIWLFAVQVKAKSMGNNNQSSQFTKRIFQRMFLCIIYQFSMTFSMYNLVYSILFFLEMNMNGNLRPCLYGAELLGKASFLVRVWKLDKSMETR